MRIISGSLKGRRFSPPKSFKARPTTDFAKENLFNMLNNRMDYEGIDVLDLFGGTGSISYEFASRGAASVVTVEKNYNHFQYIINTSKELGLNKMQRIIKADVFKFIKKGMGQYDLIFADPPYDLKEAEALPALILETNLLKDGGLLIFEHGGDYNFNNQPFFEETRASGKVHFSFFSK